MNLSFFNKQAAEQRARLRPLTPKRGKVVAAVAFGLAAVFGLAGHAMAAGAVPVSPAGGLGAQINLLSGEGINAGSTGFGALCYIAATLCFFGGSWALWSSRQPQNRESGHAMRGVAGLVLCGLFATAGVWINKSAISASGAAATVNDNVGMVQFGG